MTRDEIKRRIFEAFDKSAHFPGPDSGFNAIVACVEEIIDLVTARNLKPGDVVSVNPDMTLHVESSSDG